MGLVNYKNVPGAQVLGNEKEFLKGLAERAVRDFGKDLTIVNIGIMWGCTLWCLRAGAPQTTNLYGVDIAPDKWKITGKEELKAKIVQGDSHKLWKTFEHPIHLLFIDGDHHYKSVKQDLNWTSLVVEGGYVAFHDYRPSAHNLKQFPELEGVRRAVDEWQQEVRWQNIPAPGSLKAFKNA